MKSKKIKLAAGALSAALLFTGVGGGVGSLIQDGTFKGTEVQAAARRYSDKSEAELRKIVLKKVPGTVLNVYKEWDDGILEYKYTIKKADGSVYKVEINSYGRITDIDFEGRYSTGKFYDEDYYDDDYYDWD